jgi:hypothetical protein
MIDKIRVMCETDPERSLTYVGGASLVIDGPYVVWPILRPYIIPDSAKLHPGYAGYLDSKRL